jgi:hypothetical protein
MAARAALRVARLVLQITATSSMYPSKFPISNVAACFPQFFNSPLFLVPTVFPFTLAV